MSGPASFEVLPAPDGYRWQLITAAGRPVVYSRETYPTDFAAAEAAKVARNRFDAHARQVDGGGILR